MSSKIALTFPIGCCILLGLGHAQTKGHTKTQHRALNRGRVQHTVRKAPDYPDQEIEPEEEGPSNPDEACDCPPGPPGPPGGSDRDTDFNADKKILAGNTKDRKRPKA